MSTQVDPERLLVGILRDALSDVVVNVEHAPSAHKLPMFLQVRVLPGGIVYRHAQTSHYDVNLVGWSTVDRHTAQQICARALEALRLAWLRQSTTNAPGALANYAGGQAPYAERLPGAPEDTYRYSCTASIGVRT